MEMNTGKKARFLAAFWIMIFALVICSCGQKDSKDKSIEIHITEQVEKNNKKIQIPEFYSKNEEVNRNLKDLDRKCKYLQKIVEKEEEKNSDIEMLSFVSDVKGYPQVTVVWYTLEEGTLSYNIMTLGADEKNSLPITSKEALEMTGMSGVDLSLKVGKLVQESQIRGELTSTEMQGFRIDEGGNVEEIYMKLVFSINENDEEIEEEHFFSYFPKEEKLVKLYERGFKVP